ncbi:hypothetical protein T261_1579 [Streptomyces lydicus]|nr:hypothetical protein T261_1579 [Streptomyces lydicus]
MNCTEQILSPSAQPGHRMQSPRATTLPEPGLQWVTNTRAAYSP